MQKNYFFILLITLACFTTQIGFSQSNATNPSIHQNIDGLSIYPNPVSNGKTYIYITSKRNLTKKVQFFNVLGKQIYVTMLTGKELNISQFSKGVYILKITEGTVSETRKLVIK
ncbi:T9SS type A sorting domain-containing protein [Snuella sedimenti]|uniref:T9SS type A sorting domain-containing protein n=1 Tax=Snuella sedimenti TaxID=2798802 RepID=A0A8J7IGF7_9FLAO|nr:T9SS type A sorting domain-containing protein [Snuella sedimenti]MBJ6369122.1 T9SS type A sorting domain-containing protein [Snuella sedimenti]